LTCESLLFIVYIEHNGDESPKDYDCDYWVAQD